MAYWLHTTHGKSTLYGDKDQARQALKNHVAAWVGKGYKSKETEADHFLLTHPSQGYAEAYIDTEGPDVGGDDET